jgi:non-lysosomal glucosylceramidase
MGSLDMDSSSVGGVANGFNFVQSNTCGTTGQVGGGCCLPHGIDRRVFLRAVGAGTLAVLGFELPVMAGPFDNPNFDVNIPADKKLNPEWVKALFERGQPEVFSHAQLDTIRLPIGGICAGHVYLNGEGRMTGWNMSTDVFELAQGFVLETVVDGKTGRHSLGKQAFPDMTFRGEYPVAKVTYADAAVPIEASARIFSPFIPLNADESGLPATIFNFTLKNTSASSVEATLVGGLQNGVCMDNPQGTKAIRRNQILREGGLTVLECSAEVGPDDPNTPIRPDIIFEDWNKPTFEGWTVEGTAFKEGPVERRIMEDKMGDIGGQSPRLVSSLLAATEGEAATGKLTSAAFTISRNFIVVWIGGGKMPDKTCVNLLVDGKVVRTQTGPGHNPMSFHSLDVRDLEGKQAQLQIVDSAGDYMGHIGVGRIAFRDLPGTGTPLDELTDYGTMTLALMGAPADVAIAKATDDFDGAPGDDASVKLTEKLIGALGRKIQLKPGESAEINFVVTWYFPYQALLRVADKGRYYTNRFHSARAVAEYVSTNFDHLNGATRLWNETWYDSTLPYWFLDRTFIPASTMATSGCMRFTSGRFWAWEGGPASCEGTCTHVWQYAHSLSRLFPALERDTRERVDMGIAFCEKSGEVGYRGEYNMTLAVDGQAGTILRIYREHQMSPDSSFLKRNWNKVKLMYKPLFALDQKEEGIMDGQQRNTLDRAWAGQISWMSSMYCAACRAGEQMANEVGDAEFAAKCKKIADNGYTNISTRLFNGEYFFSTIDPKHVHDISSGDGSLMDQVYGQSRGFQVGLPRILPEKETRTALKSRWTYNFSPDAGAYFASKNMGRKMVEVGDAGMILCTFPRTDWTFQQASGGDKAPGGFAYYFVECWTGMEYQVAGHMLWEGMLTEPLVMVRAIHDRYSPLKRNPYSEIECGSHYTRAMASHGVFIGACGYQYHGPKGEIGFAPKLTPEDFRAPFTAAEGWGTYSQKITNGEMAAAIELKKGTLRFRIVSLVIDGHSGTPSAKVTLSGTDVAGTCSVIDGQIKVQFTEDVVIPEGQKLSIKVS